MMRRAHNRSQRGASLPLALLLFLICALLASVVLAASTTVAGRHSQLAAMDQRYYGVTSAVNLIRGAFASEDIDIECVQVKDTSTIVTYSPGGAISRTESADDVKSVVLTVDGKQVMSAAAQGESAALNTSALTLPELCALYAVLGGKPAGDVDASAVWDAAAFDAADASDVISLGTYDLTAAVSSTTAAADPADIQSALAAVMYARLVDGAVLELQVDSVADGESDLYSLTLECDADLDASEWVEEEKAADQASGTTTTRTERATVTTTRSVAIAWVPSALYKTGAAS